MLHRPHIGFRQALWMASQAILWAGLILLLVLAVLPRVTPYDVLVVRGGGSTQPGSSRSGAS